MKSDGREGQDGGEEVVMSSERLRGERTSNRPAVPSKTPPGRFSGCLLPVPSQEATACRAAGAAHHRRNALCMAAVSGPGRHEAREPPTDDAPRAAPARTGSGGWAAPSAASATWMRTASAVSAADRARIEALKLPPAWTDVAICPTARAPAGGGQGRRGALAVPLPRVLHAETARRRSTSAWWRFAQALPRCGGA